MIASSVSSACSDCTSVCFMGGKSALSGCSLPPRNLTERADLSLISISVVCDCVRSFVLLGGLYLTYVATWWGAQVSTDACFSHCPNSEEFFALWLSVGKQNHGLACVPARLKVPLVPVQDSVLKALETPKSKYQPCLLNLIS